MSACGKFTVLYQDGQQCRAFRGFCKNWDCDRCAPYRKRMLCDALAAGSPTAMLTLSVSSNDGRTIEQRAKWLVRCKQVLTKRIRRQYALERLPHAWVLEPQKSGNPHLHVLLRTRYLPHAWLRANWRDISGGTGCHIEKIDSGVASARYIAKYLNKRPLRLRGTRPYFMSRGWKIAPREKPKHWWDQHRARVLRATTLEQIKAAVREHGYRVIEESDDAIEFEISNSEDRLPLAFFEAYATGPPAPRLATAPQAVAHALKPTPSNEVTP